MPLIRSFINFGKRQSFQPNVLSIFLNPFYFTRLRLWRGLKVHRDLLHGRLLDFGCGRKPFKDLFQVDQYIGVDIKTSGHDNQQSSVDVYYDGKVLPFESESFDSLFCSEVFEHIFNPQVILPEIYRVLKPGAVGLITVPFGWPEHEVPYDYARYSSFGIKHLLETHNFKVVSVTKTGHYIEVLWQLLILYIFNLFATKNRIANTALTILFISPFNLIGIVLTAIFPHRKDLFFTSIVVVEKPG